MAGDRGCRRRARDRRRRRLRRDRPGTPYKTIWGMGRLNHENNVAVPGYGKPVLLSGDDSFNQVAAQSQVYAYIANDADAVWNDQGNLYAFVPDDAYAAVNDYFDFGVGSTASISGKFIEVPKEIATGKDADGNDVTSADFGYPSAAAVRRDVAARARHQQRPRHRRPAVGPRALERPAQRLPVPAHRGHRHRQAAGDVQRRLPGRLGPWAFATISRSQVRRFRSTNGRIWKMVLDPNDPTTVTSLSVLIEGDDNPVKTVGEIHQPDNLETTLNGLYITEDPGSCQQFDAAQQVNDAASRHDRPAVAVQVRRRRPRRRGQGRPVGRRRPDGRGHHDDRRPLGRVGVDGRRRRLVDLRSRQVPDQRPGSHAVRRTAGRDQLDEQARGRSAAADHHPGRLTPGPSTTREAGPDGSGLPIPRRESPRLVGLACDPRTRLRPRQAARQARRLSHEGRARRRRLRRQGAEPAQPRPRATGRSRRRAARSTASAASSTGSSTSR